MRFDALNCSGQAALSVCQFFFGSDRTYNPGSYNPVQMDYVDHRRPVA